MRITGGAHRSLPLKAPKGDRTRPTSDRVREAIFDVLASSRDLDGARVLDLYAGTGALGLEALSRGASSATLVEEDGAALRAIDANVRALRVEDRVRVVRRPVERAVAALNAAAPLDVAFADPPYALVAGGELTHAVEQLVRARVLADGATLVLEHGKRDPSPIFAGLRLVQSRRYGDTVVAFYAVELDREGTA